MLSAVRVFHGTEQILQRRTVLVLCVCIIILIIATYFKRNTSHFVSRRHARQQINAVKCGGHGCIVYPAGHVCRRHETIAYDTDNRLSEERPARRVQFVDLVVVVGDIVSCVLLPVNGHSQRNWPSHIRRTDANNDRAIDVLCRNFDVAENAS